MRRETQLLRIQKSEGSPHRLLVACPNDQRPVRLERCLACVNGEGVEVHGRNEAYIRCHPVDPPQRPRGARQVLISEAMTSEVVTVDADTSIETVIWLLLTRGFGGAPVLDGERGLVGIITSSDLLRAQIGESSGWGPETSRPDEAAELDSSEITVRALTGLCARDVMTPVVLTLPDNASLAMASALMAMERIHRVLIVSPSDPTEVVGILSSLDVLRWLALDEGYVLAEGE